MSLIIFVTFSAINLISRRLTTVSRTFIQLSNSVSLSALSSSMVIYTAAFATFSLFLLLMRSSSKGFINDAAHSFYILSSQSRRESYIKVLCQKFNILNVFKFMWTYNYERKKFLISSCLCHIPIEVIDYLYKELVRMKSLNLTYRDLLYFISFFQ